MKSSRAPPAFEATKNPLRGVSHAARQSPARGGRADRLPNRKCFVCIQREDITMTMTSTRALALASGLLIAGVAALQVAPPASGQSGPGWTQLFDGRTMNGWDQVGTANWRVEDGALVADKSTAPARADGQPGGGGHLVTKASYKDHMLYAE